MNSLLTFAVPNFNGAQYLRETLESLRAQDGRVRWWMQDACSDDGSTEIARAFATPADRVVVERDGGQADAINRAFAAMGGDLLGWINSDDRLAPGAAEAVLRAFADNPDADLVYGGVDWIDAGGRTTGHHTGNIRSLTEMLDIYGVWWNGRQWVQPEVFFRRRLWEKAGPLDTRFDLAFDFAFWVRCMEAGARAVRLPTTLVEFRLHPAQKSTRAHEAADEIRVIVGEALARNPQLPRAFARRLGRHLAFDRFQSGQDWRDPASRPGLARMLLRHPAWLLVPEVRRRLAARLGWEKKEKA